MNAPALADAIVVAAGSSSRMGGDLPKQFRQIAGKAVIAHAVDSLAAHPAVRRIVVVVAPGEEARTEVALAGRAVTIVPGGASRRLSVSAGLDALSGDAPRQVLVHDAARPFVPLAVIDRLLETLNRYEGAIPGLPIADTLVEWEGIIGETVPRENVYRVQTPQAFLFDVLLAAHRTWPADQEATDDAQMVRDTAHEVCVVAGDSMLEKLTYPTDFASAEARLGRISRTGLGYDVHAFCEGDHVWLGGIRVPHGRALAGHSDADVALHALTDAILGAIGDGDIGAHFPPSDPQWKGASSDRFLVHARDLVLARGGRIDHVDVTVICEAPKVRPHAEAMRARIADLLQIGVDRVSVKATTTERLGFTGREEGIAAQAVATISTWEGL
jgi:2-C-methyl-D-erythritol 4-phosphate cytidylyltransferase/2-C-methyl-D-erythritol 2,4-cyclodiphosphate synthase